MLGRSVLELELARIWEEHVHDDALGRGEQDLVDELLVLVVAGVGADQLHLRARQRHIEDARVRGVREVEAHHLAVPRLEVQIGLAGDQHHVAEPAHRHVGRLLLPKAAIRPSSIRMSSRVSSSSRFADGQ